MAAQGRRRMSLQNGSEGQGIVARALQSGIVQRTKQVANDASFVTKKLANSTGKAAWIVGTTFLILGVPLIIAMDREQQLNEMDLHQSSVYGNPSSVMQ